jgi:hypothetical protein
MGGEISFRNPWQRSPFARIKAVKPNQAWPGDHPLEGGVPKLLYQRLMEGKILRSTRAKIAMTCFRGYDLRAVRPG